jgi:hypothetical protein
VERHVGVVLVQRVAWNEPVSLSWGEGTKKQDMMCLPTMLAVFPEPPLPDRSTCWMVGLEGDFIILTCCEGTHGWAVTKLMSLSKAKLCSFSSPESISVTVKVTDAA